MSSLLTESPSGEVRHGESDDGNLALDAALDISELDFIDLEDEDLDTAINFAGFLDTPAPNEVARDSSLESLGCLVHEPPALARSFNRRSNIKTGAQMIANLILHTLKSYPLMILRHNCLPPFVHPSMITPHAENDDMEPLTNCLSLVHMLSSRFRGSRKLFWKNVHLECEWLCAEHLRLNKRQLLAAMQALSIYMLIRLDEGETAHNNVDSLLLTTIIATATQFNLNNTTSNTQSALYKPSLNSSWEEWILQESARRLCVVYQVVGMLVHFEPAAMCDQPNLILAPLPARKQLWEASDEQVWNAEIERELGRQTNFGLAANGDLVRLDEDQSYCGHAVLQQSSLDSGLPSRSMAKWEEWCSGMDGFGGLIMLAASFVAQ